MAPVLAFVALPPAKATIAGEIAAAGAIQYDGKKATVISRTVLERYEIKRPDTL